MKPGPVKRIFAPFKGDRISNLSWDPPPTPPGVRKRRAIEMAAASYVPPPPIQQQPAASQQQDGNTTLPGPPSIAIGTTQEAPKLSHPQDASATEVAEAETQPEASVISSDEGVVDFMTDEESLEMPNLTAADGQHRDTALSRFDDSDDEHMPEAQLLQQTTSISAAAAPDMSTFDDSDDEQLPSDEFQQQAAFTASAASHDLSRLANSKTGVAVGAPQPSQTAAAAPELPRRNDSTDEQMQDDPLHQHARSHLAAVAAASNAAAQDMSRFDDSDDAHEEQKMPVSHLLPYSAKTAHVDILSSQAELDSPSASEPASEPASETAAAPGSAANAEQLSSASSLSGNVSSSAAEDDQAGADSCCDPLENATDPQQPPSLQDLSVRQMQSPAASSESQQDSDAGSQPSSDEENEQPSADSDGSHAGSESQSSEDTPTIPKSNHDDGNLLVLADASSNRPDQSQASVSSEQDNADSTDLLQTTAEGRISPQHVDVQDVESQHAQHDEAAPYPGTLSLSLIFCTSEAVCSLLLLYCDQAKVGLILQQHTQLIKRYKRCFPGMWLVCTACNRMPVL